jgi:hypothetical protein
MSTHPLRRGLVGLVAAAAVVIAAAAPAAAVPVTGSIANGFSMVLDSNVSGPDVTFVTPPTTGSPCTASTTPAEIDIEFTSGTTSVEGFRFPFDFFQNTFLFGSYWYRQTLELSPTFGSRAGSITGGASPYAMTQDLPLIFKLYRIGPVGGPYDCTGGNLVCQTLIELTLTGTWTPTAPNTSTAPPGVASLSGTGVTNVFGTCAAPFIGWYDNANVAVSSLQATFP